MKIKQYLKLYPLYFAQNLKSRMEYRLDFFIGLLGFFFLQTCGVVFITLIFSSIPNLKGWSFYEVLFIYGFAQIPRGLDHIFTDNLWLYAGWKISKGEMDRLLTRPLNPLFQLIAERFQPDGIGEFLIGIILSVIAVINLDITFTFGKVIAVVITVIFGALTITGIKIFFTAFSFWVKRSQSYLYTAYNFNEFCYYPISIYNNVIQFILTFIIPFAVTSYFPSAYFLEKESFSTGFIFPIVISITTFSIAYNFWKIGLKHYESAGS